MGLIYLYLYAFAMILITVKSIINKNNSTMYRFMWVIYSVVAVFCVLCKEFQDTLVGRGRLHDEWYNLSNSSVWAYILLIVCSYIAFRPFKKYRINYFYERFNGNRTNRQLLPYFAYAYIILFLCYVVFSYQIVLSIFLINDFGALRNSLYGNLSHESTVVLSTNIVGNISFKICWALRLIEIFIGCELIKNGRKALGFTLLFCDMLLVYIYSNLNAARGGLLIFLFCSALIVFPFIRVFSKKTKRLILVIAIIVGLIGFLFTMEVTISRTADNLSGGNVILQNICFYLGHAPIEFSKIVGSIRGLGFGSFIGGRLLNHYFNVPYNVESLKAEVGIPSELRNLFTTYLYPVYIDFGTLGCVLFFFLWSYFMNRLLQKKKLRLSTIYMFLYYLNFFVTGAFVISTLEFASLFTTTGVWLILRLIEDQLSLKYKRQSGSLVLPQENTIRSKI